MDNYAKIMQTMDKLINLLTTQDEDELSTLQMEDIKSYKKLLSNSINALAKRFYNN